MKLLSEKQSEVDELKREIKKKISEISSSKKLDDMQLLSGLEKEMTQLREAWEAWEKKRKEAAKVRMVLLGHEEEKGSDLK